VPQQDIKSTQTDNVDQPSFRPHRSLVPKPFTNANSFLPPPVNFTDQIKYDKPIKEFKPNSLMITTTELWW
jgi:hypothetical protein